MLAREKGATVPVIISFEERNVDVGRSILITDEIPGSPLSDRKNEIADQILIQAGRDLARINQIRVDGFGPINTEPGSTELNAQHKTYTEFLLDDVDGKIDKLIESQLIDEQGANKLRDFIEQNRSQFEEVHESHLAHGDFDLTHIFEENNEYTGIIDFGEIQGASIYQDLAHFYIYSQKHIDKLVEGYKQITNLPDDYMRRIRAEAVVFVINKLARIVEFQPDRLPKFKKLLRVINNEVLND
jgi:aminoglycoside phosphotransferase